MKYLAVLDDILVSKFKLYNGDMIVKDENGMERKITIKPIQRYTLVMPDGSSIYLTDDHIQALIKFEQNNMIDDMLKNINKTLDKLPKSYFSKEELRRQFGLEGEKE